MTDDEKQEMLYLRYVYNEMQHSIGQALEKKFTGDTGLAVPDKYRRNPSVSYESKGVTRRKRNGYYKYR